MVQIPAVDGREVVEQDDEGYESCKVRHDHSECGDDEVCTVTHLALEILYEDLAVYG